MKKRSPHQRVCPQCNKPLTYVNKSNFNAAVKRNSPCRDCMNVPDNKQGDLSPLLLDTPESYYWMGFLLADGHFSAKGVMKITLASIDRSHLLKLKKFLHIKNMQEENNGKAVCIKTMDTKLVPIITSKFDISNKKTYQPPNLSFIKDRDLLMSLIIGYIDGDGCIAKKAKGFSLNIHCHASWLKTIDSFVKAINPTSTARIRPDGYASASVSNNESLKELKRFAINKNLPILKRKWDKIDLDFIPYQEQRMRQFKQLKKNILKYRDLPWFGPELYKFVSQHLTQESVHA